MPETWLRCGSNAKRPTAHSEYLASKNFLAKAYIGTTVIIEIAKPSPRVIFTYSRKLFESIILKKGEMKIDQPNVFRGCSVKSPLLCDIPRKTYPKASSSGRTVKSTVCNLKPSDIREIRIKKNIICFFFNYYFLT